MILEASDLKARPSALGLIMGGAEGKLTQTAKNWVEEVYLVSHGRCEPSFQGNEYTKKGWAVEDAAINDYQRFKGLDGLVKNEEKFSNDYIEGTPDVLLYDGKTVVDIKSPWSHIQFNKYASFSTTRKYPCPSASYFWQLQAYMWLTGRDYAELAYVLMNTPKEILSLPAPKRRGDKFVDYEKEISLEKRVKVFGFKRSNEHICRIKNKIELLREHLELVVIPEWT